MSHSHDAQVSTTPGLCVLIGALDARHCEAVRASFSRLLRAPGHAPIIVDSRGVRTIDACVVAEFVAVSYRAGANGRTVVLVDDQGPVTEALAQAHLLDLFELADKPPERDRDHHSEGNRAG
jgi:anti-anti-sigma factor